MRQLLIAVLALGLAGQAQAFKLNLDAAKDMFKQADDALGEKDPAQERAIGRGVAARLLGATPLQGDPEVQAYLNRLGRWIALHSERPELRWHFGVLDTQAVNAFAAPGGYVFVTRGLLLRLRSEDELAAVLAHEIAHVLDRHHLAAIQKHAGAGLLGSLAKLAADRHEAGAELTKAIDAGTELYARGLDKADEYAADRKGAVLTARAGYDPYALLAVLQTLAATDPGDSAVALMFKTHPRPQQRLDRLAPLLAAHLQDAASAPPPASRFAAAVQRLRR